MGLLAPLYALAAVAIVGPIIFHLIRRQPLGQLQFSSLMFLSPSPPRLTRRSRLDNLLLLLLRALAIGLIAFAFARPYLRQESFLSTSMTGRQIVILLDTSASMQRESVWQSAKDELAELLSSLAADDRVALYTIDDSTTPIVALDDQQNSKGDVSHAAVRAAMEKLQPGWRRTELAEGLRTIADVLNAARISGSIRAGTQPEIVLISDLHTGCGLDSLQGYPWPEKIRLDVRRILPDKPGNARPSLMVASEADSDEQLRVRIENDIGSRDQAFELVWSSSVGPTEANRAGGANSRVQVPPGQVRIIPMPSQPAGTDRISLIGDAWDGDNDVYIVRSQPQFRRIAFLGTSQPKPEQDLVYFLSQAPLSTGLVQRQVEVIELEGLPIVTQDPETKVVVLEPRPGILEHAHELREFAASGGTVLVCLARANSDALPTEEFLRELLKTDDLRVSEARVDDFALFGWIDYQHPVFAPFADPKYNDFSKIRFWSHRRLDIPEASSSEATDLSSMGQPAAAAPSSQLKVIARYDDEDPLLVQQTVGSGHIWVLTTGWQPTAGGLGLSSKFVPIMMGLLDPAGVSRRRQESYEVGERIPLIAKPVRVLDSQDRELSEDQLEQGSEYLRIFEPGVFRFEGANTSRTVAVQVPANESRLLPLDADVFEQYGIALGAVVSEKERLEAARQMKVEELEGQQRLWQWLIAAGLVVLAVETFLAGWLNRKQMRQLATS